MNLGAREGDFAHSHIDCWSGPHTNPNKKHIRFATMGETAEVQDEDSHVDFVDENQPVQVDSARNSFSLALKECQEKRSRSEALFKKAASVDTNNAVGSLPKLQTVKNSSLSSPRSGAATFSSPGMPDYRVAMQKGWSSERVPLHTGAACKNVFLLNNGRTLPSKWEDAERWILSPVSGDGMGRVSLPPPPQRKPKSKSGPLGPPGIAYHSLYSPAMPMIERGNFMAASPFSTDGFGHDRVLSLRTDSCMSRSASVRGCSRMQSQSSISAQEDNIDGFKAVRTNVSHVISRRDMATQMSPQGSSCSSPDWKPSFSASTSSALPITESQSVVSSKMDIRDVQVDERVTIARWSKKHRGLFSGRNSEYVESWKKQEICSQSSTWETSKTVSKAKSEEAKITAWENLQKAKAEAAIRNLEMKLEKRRASSMDKIMNKVSLAQKKAQEMRRSVSPNEVDQVVRTSHKASSFLRIRQLRSLSSCLTCHVF